MSPADFIILPLSILALACGAVLFHAWKRGGE